MSALLIAVLWLGPVTVSDTPDIEDNAASVDESSGWGGEVLATVAIDTNLVRKRMTY